MYSICVCLCGMEKRHKKRTLKCLKKQCETGVSVLWFEINWKPLLLLIHNVNWRTEWKTRETNSYMSWIGIAFNRLCSTRHRHKNANSRCVTTKRQYLPLYLDFWSSTSIVYSLFYLTACSTRLTKLMKI